MVKITKSAVDRIQTDQEDSVIWDEVLPGFGVRVRPSGTKSYVVQYRDSSRRTRRVTLGRHGVITAEQARRLAKETLAEVVQGGDPAARRRKSGPGPTVRELAERYMTEHAEPKKSPRACEEDRRMLDTYVIPKLGTHKVADVGRSDVAELHHEMRDKPIQANRVVSLCNRLFNWAERWGLRPDGTNPCRHVQKYREEAKERYLSTEELRRIGQALRKLEEEEHGEGKERRPVRPQAIFALRLLLLTGARRGEILGLRWEDVDLERGLLHLPMSKTGAKVVTLSTAAQDLLSRAPRTSEWVIPSPTTEGPWRELKGPWKRVKDKVAELQEAEIADGELKPKDKVDVSDVRIHDLRHSFASVGAGAGLSLPVIGALLGHSQPQTTARYSHLASDPLRQAADVISGHIAAVLECRVAAEVVELRQKRAK